ncbi:DNA-3-methyladenine glycosylase [Micromonospora parva]|uniref:DNA-3-methyladenine glycosylase n=1 Tax=Micromonospora parva TaxID=1464048 RepID=UPI00378C55C4
MRVVGETDQHSQAGGGYVGRIVQRPRDSFYTHSGSTSYVGQGRGGRVFAAPAPAVPLSEDRPAGKLRAQCQSYGMHWCVNVVTGVEGTATAVLLRAGEVVDGLATARERRPAIRRDVDLARGPARLCSALGIDREAYGAYLLGDGPVRLRPPARPVPQEAVAAGPRVGVTGAHDLPWRFWLDGDPTVSAYRRHVPRVRR